MIEVSRILRLLRLSGLSLLLAAGAAAHANIYGYVDANGTAHFAAEKVDERYQLFFKEGQRFDTAEGLGRAPALGGAPGTRAASLIALFEKAPNWGSASSALKTAAARHDIDVELLQALVAAESGFNAQAISPKGAIGLMQLMPATAQRYGVRGDARRTLESKLHDPQINIAAGSRYLRDLIAMFDGSLELALAAYNAGEGAVQRAGNRIPDYRETQNYVKTVLAIYAHLKPAGTRVTQSRTGAARGTGGRAPARVRMELPAARPAADAVSSD
ncbi:lytic transglycosylase domain-containing protein [Xenophilus arseniciresistens]|uniref:Lytic transglycosylase domain-containing protein n=1 Tax=Xenophilus arseniciresistens TaxID=1283306 RepID=A0AAE3SY66_9BURK|nr:lytic transglycosylase domain-containing protein [Xenophilus arseniciresistens]MDA7415699.1 lytic transglycosylase domain-containing protein [Xenophilus arseniciresistens]